MSWHEAVAFCRWLDFRRHEQRTVPHKQIRLPTEWEWQQAATGGDPKRTYPWGQRWEPGKLNAEGEIGRTTAVGLYPRGASPCKALDMAGNVWEWCLNKYDRAEDTALGGDDLRVLRGGSWLGGQDRCRAAYCDGADPDGRDGDLGFRVCLSSPIALRPVGSG